MEKQAPLIDYQTQLLHWKSEPDVAFQGKNQVVQQYMPSFPTDEVSQDATTPFQVVVRIEILNESRGLIFQAHSQTIFQLNTATQPPDLSTLLDCVVTAHQAFEKQFEERKSTCSVTQFSLHAPSVAEVGDELKRVLQFKYGSIPA